MKTALIALAAFGSIVLAAPAHAERNGNPVDCAFNPAFAGMHTAQCKGVTIEKVASNGGPGQPATLPAAAAAAAAAAAQPAP